MRSIKTAFTENEFNNSKVLITGNTGFKGSWLSLWLSNLGAGNRNIKWYTNITLTF